MQIAYILYGPYTEIGSRGVFLTEAYRNNNACYEKDCFDRFVDVAGRRIVRADEFPQSGPTGRESAPGRDGQRVAPRCGAGFGKRRFRSRSRPAYFQTGAYGQRQFEYEFRFPRRRRGVRADSLQYGAGRAERRGRHYGARKRVGCHRPDGQKRISLLRDERSGDRDLRAGRYHADSGRRPRQRDRRSELQQQPDYDGRKGASLCRFEGL